MPNLYPFLAYVFVTTFTPGPNNVLAMTNAMHAGYRRTIGFLAGMMAGFVVIMLFSGLINAVLASLIPPVRFWLNLFGAAYMIYLAVTIVRSSFRSDHAESQGMNTFGAGFALQFVNLKLILYGVTVYSIFITPFYRTPLPVILFALALTCVGFVSVSAWALGGNLFRRFLQKYHLWFNLAMAALLIYAAVAGLLLNHSV
jgi:threonine/homoserine/homoserine lactone efflux protein